MTEGFMGPEEIVNKKREFIIPCLNHFYQEPVQFVRGRGQYLYDSNGRQYLDFFAGVSVINAGHCHPEIAARICDQVWALQHVCNIYLTQPLVELAERLARVAPGRLQKSFFCNSGSEANEGAVLLARLATGRSELLALQDGLYGRTYMGMSLTGLRMWRTDPNPAGGISFVPNAYCYRCPMNLTYPACDLACAEAVARVIETSTSGAVAALIAEPIQGNGGIITPPPEYFSRVREILKKYGALLIIDEVQSGFGRTGKWFAIEHWGVEPEIMTVAKALGNGVPIGAFIAVPEVADRYTRPGASTLGGNPVSMTAGLATLDVIEKQGLAQNAAELGAHLKEQLLALKEKHPLIGDVRGLGLMLGAELVKNGRAPATGETDRVLELMKNRGVLIGKNGRSRNVLAFQPPLVITRGDAEEMLRQLDGVLAEVERGGAFEKYQPHRGRRGRKPKVGVEAEAGAGVEAEAEGGVEAGVEGRVTGEVKGGVKGKSKGEKKSALFRKMYDTGKTVSQIARETHDHYAFVYSVIKRHCDRQGLPMRLGKGNK